MSIDAIIENFIDSQNGTGVNFSGGLASHITLGVIVDVDDPLQQGRIRAFCPTLNDDVKQVQYVPWALFASPFSGMVDNSSYTRGSGDGPETTSGSVHYGLWAIPEVGSHVLIMCIDGDYKRRVCIGCVPHHQKTQTIMNGRFKWDGGEVDGPLSGNDSPIEPLYTNVALAFDNKKDSAEWKTRIVEYQVTATRDDSGQVPNSVNNKNDQTINDIIANEPKSWTHPMLGSHGYDWTGFKNLGAFLSPRVYGMSTPGMHSITMDDRHFNNRMRFRTSTGHQILLDDVNERIYISTNKGKNYVEMDSCGNVDIFSEMRVSIHAENDVNISTDETFRVHAKKGIHLFSGEKDEQESLEEIPADGQIRIHAVDDIHVITENNYRHLSKNNSLYEIGGKKCETIGESLFLQVQKEINIVTNTGDFNLTVSGNVNDFIKGNSFRYALGSMRNMSELDNHLYSFREKIDVGAQKVVNIKSIGEDIILEAVGKNGGKSGGIYTKSPKSYMFLSDKGLALMTEESFNFKTKKDSSMEVDPTLNVDGLSSDALMSGVSLFSAPNDDTFPLDGFSGADLAARAAYNAGFRGEDLITIVAISGAETSYDPNYTTPPDGKAEVWGNSVGMWKIRTVVDPEKWGDMNSIRDVTQLLGFDNINNNAKFAKWIVDKLDYREWPSFCDETYRSFISEAAIAVDTMLNGMLNGLMEASDPSSFAPFGNSLREAMCASSMSSRSMCMPNLSLSTNTNISLGISGINLQSKLDTAFKSLASNVQSKLADGIVSQINKNADALNKFQARTISFMNMFMGPASSLTEVVNLIQSIQSFLNDIIYIDSALMVAAGLGVSFKLPLDLGQIVPDFPWNALLGDICNYQIPPFDGAIWANFGLSGFDLCSSTTPSFNTEFGCSGPLCKIGPPGR